MTARITEAVRRAVEALGGAPFTQADLAAAAGVSRTSVSLAVRALVAAGHVVRLPGGIGHGHAPFVYRAADTTETNGEVHRCSVCAAPVTARADGRARTFCSPECRRIAKAQTAYPRVPCAGPTEVPHRTPCPSRRTMAVADDTSSRSSVRRCHECRASVMAREHAAREAARAQARAAAEASRPQLVIDGVAYDSVWNGGEGLTSVGALAGGGGERRPVRVPSPWRDD